MGYEVAQQGIRMVGSADLCSVHRQSTALVSVGQLSLEGYRTLAGDAF
jgi:hypothetical protein